MSNTVLLVAEDDATVLMTIEDALVEAGFEVVSVINGKQAIAELEKDAERFKGLVTDIRMGAGPRGWEVAHRARELNPTVPVVYMSGDSEKEWAANGVPNSIMLAKPFALAQMVVAISQLINAAGPQT